MCDLPQFLPLRPVPDLTLDATKKTGYLLWPRVVAYIVFVIIPLVL